MTAIAAVKEGGKIFMAGDSAGVSGHSLAVRKDPKVFFNGEFLIGYTTSFRMGQILRFHFSPPKPTEGHDAYEYMVTTFVATAREAFKQHGFGKNGGDEGGQFLVGWRGELYSLFSDYQVAILSDDYCACGCGADLVLGSLHATDAYDIPPKERLTMAMSAAERFSSGVVSPFVVLESQ